MKSTLRLLVVVSLLFSILISTKTVIAGWWDAADYVLRERGRRGSMTPYQQDQLSQERHRNERNEAHVAINAIDDQAKVIAQEQGEEAVRTYYVQYKDLFEVYAPYRIGKDGTIMPVYDVAKIIRLSKLKDTNDKPEEDTKHLKNESNLRSESIFLENMRATMEEDNAVHVSPHGSLYTVSEKNGNIFITDKK